MANALKDAVKELRMFNLFSLEGLIEESQKNDAQFITKQFDVSNNNPLITKLRELLIETQRGAFTSKQLIVKLLELESDFEQEGLKSPLPTTIIPHFDDETAGVFGTSDSITAVIGSDTINESAKSDRNSPTVSVYQILSSRISPVNKNTDAVSIFMNTIPTIEMSRAVPYLNVTFQLSRPPEVNGQINSLSLIKFLEGASYYNGSADGSMVRANSSLNLAGEYVSGSAGMEIFTSPQTLVNAEPESVEDSRIVPVIDPFRPLASLTQFQVDVTPAPGIMSYRTGKLKFTVHDRSRLYEFADFIKPDMYNQAEILIEYGWSHPDGDSKENPFGAFINAMRVKEKYQVKNNTFAFKNNGEVLVDLELYTKGAEDMYTSNIQDTSDQVQGSQKFIQNLQEKIGELRDRIYNKQDKRLFKEIRGAQILNAASDGNAELKLTKELKKELTKTLKALGKEGAGSDAKNLRQALIDLYGADKSGNGGAVKKLEQSIGAAIRTKIEKIRRGEKQTGDPFFIIPQSSANSDMLDGIKTKYVSLAKLFLLFVVEPLASTAKFDDIQLFFYKFNEQAGIIGGPNGSNNIGSFAIDIDNFHTRYQKVAVSRRSANLTLRDFVTFVNNAFIEDPSNPNYGMGKLYTQNKNGELPPKPKKEYADTNILSREVEKIMKVEAGIPDGVFKMPYLNVFIECVSGDNTQEDAGDQTTILKIHVFDEAATPYTSQGNLLAISRNNDISTIGDVPVPQESNAVTQEEGNQAQAVIDKALAQKLIEEVAGEEGKDKVYQVLGGPNNIKEFVANTMPTIIFGVNNSAVIDAGLKSMTDNALSTINMIRAGDAGPLNPNGASQGGLPMQLMPAQMDMRTFGCPIVEYAQQFFVDMKTGTTADNIYVVTKIQHSFDGPGKFQSSFGFTPLDAYGQYRSMIQKIGAAIRLLGVMTSENEEQKPANDTKDQDY